MLLEKYILNFKGLNTMNIDKINNEYEVLLNELKEKLDNNIISETKYYEYLNQINSCYNMDLVDDCL
jgi:hypothetical protein